MLKLSEHSGFPCICHHRLNGSGVTGWWGLIILAHTWWVRSAVALVVSITTNLVWYCPHTFNLFLFCLVSVVLIDMVDEYWYKLTAMLFGAFVASYGSTLNFLTNFSDKVFLLSWTLVYCCKFRWSSWTPSAV